MKVPGRCDILSLGSIRDLTPAPNELSGGPLRTAAPQQIAKNIKKTPELNSAFERSLYLGGIWAVVLVLLVNLVIIERQEAWEDEIFAVSTGWSLARHQGTALSVLADYPKTGSPVHFYGPVSFEAEAWLIRVFGLSLLAWRLACFLGVLLCVLVSTGLVKLAGGDKWAQLITALIIALSGSVSITLPGRWDAVTSGLFLSGLLLFLRGLESVGKLYMWRCVLAGVLVGLALASTPRALTLTLAALVATVVTVLYFRRVRTVSLVGSFSMFLTAFSVQTLLLLPWGQTSISWYSYLRRATRGDSINATPLTGQGAWSLDLHHHKIVTFLLFAFLINCLFNTTAQKFHKDPGTSPVKLFLTIFASTNFILILLLLTSTLGQATFWLPPVVCAAMCWIEWEPYRRRRARAVALSLAALCLLLLCLEEAEQAAVVALTWNRRSTAALTEFVRRTIPAGAVVYGPIGGYFYPVELSRDQYLYPYERTTPGLYSKTGVSAGDTLDERICSRRSYALWPKPDPARHPETQLMPDVLRERIKGPVAEFDQPPLAGWKNLLLKQIGEVGGKYGFPDVVIYSLESKRCGAD
jgi:hypothetical protein